MSSPIFNRDDHQHPADGWYEIEVKGEHPNTAAGVVQVIDDTACQSIVNRFNADAAAGKLRHVDALLVDHEHFSSQPDKETRAYGWLMDLENRADGIYGRIRWTATGKAAVDGEDYKFFSTEYNREDCKVLNSGNPQRLRPLRLEGLTLTNMPNNRGQKGISNREAISNKTAAKPIRAARAEFAYSQKNFADMFSAIVALVRNRTGFGFTQAFNSVLSHNMDLFSGSPGIKGSYGRFNCAQSFGKLLNRAQRITGLSPVATSERSAAAIGAITNRIAPQFESVPTAFQWDFLFRAAEALAHAGAARKLFNSAALSISAADASAANSQSDDVLNFLARNPDTIPDGIGVLLQKEGANAPQIRLTFYAQIKKLISENDLTYEQAFDQLRDEQPLFWTMAMLSFEGGAIQNAPPQPINPAPLLK